MPNFVSVATSIAELAHGQKSCTQSLSHSPSLFDAPETEVFASEEIHVKIIHAHTKNVAAGCEK